jgi:hypothetical protein
LTHAQIDHFFRSYLLELSESLFVRSVIDSRRCEEIRAFTRRHAAAEYAHELLSKRTVSIPELKLNLGLKRLREMNGRNFYLIEVVVDRRRRRKRRVCFVGHRFTRAVGKTLRWNLRQVLEPYNIALDWSGQDPTSVQIFHDIVRRIRKADFCVFDTRATKGKPNVYIEAGIAYAIGTPFVLFDYAPQKPNAHYVPSLPSDLAHALSLRYATYESLFREFYFSLPVFAETNF